MTQTNAEDKTTVGVYSFRAKQLRPFVSMPLIGRARIRTEARQAEEFYFDPRAALAWLERLGDLFKPVTELKQSLPAHLARAIKEQTETRAVPAKRSANLGASGISQQRPNQLQSSAT